jgi:hypothetical protein
MNESNGQGEREKAAAIARALRLAIPLARDRGWSSERTYREAEAYAAERNAEIMPPCLEGAE